jgi:tetratricopeptide (TPR) repeat protein
MSVDCEGLYRDGNELRKQGRLDEAIQKFREAADANCRQPWLYERLAVALRKKWRRGNYDNKEWVDSEIEYLEKGIKLVKEEKERTGKYERHLKNLKDRLNLARNYRSNGGEVVDSSGTNMDKVRKFRSEVLPALSEDLDQLEITGIPGDNDNKYCDKIKKALKDVRETIENIEEKVGQNATLQARKLRDRYEYWNKIEGNSEKLAPRRRQAVKNIRNIQERLSRQLSEHGEYVDEVDGQFVKSLYNPMKKLVADDHIRLHFSALYDAVEEYAPK